jgi:Ca-activated chloride channel homolog
MTFAQPFFLLLLLFLPVLAWWRGRRGQQAAFLYSSVDLLKGVSNIRRSDTGRILPVMRWFALALFIIGLARPQKVDTETAQKASGVDIVVALDMSGSMKSEDFKLKGQPANRLAVAKDVLRKFIDRRPNDRIGIVAFGVQAFLAAPLTLDHEFLYQNLDRLELDVIDGSRTAIGSGLSVAVNRLRELKSKSKIVILMTDGQNNSGNIPPLTAAEAAQALKVKTYTIGVGTHGTAPMPAQDLFGRKVYQQVPVDIDEDTLKAIAAKTGGKYYRADSTDTLRKIYDEIDQLEKTEVEVKKYVRAEELMHWAVVPGLVLLLLEILLNHTIWRRLP